MTADQLRAWLRDAPSGTMVPVDALAPLLEDVTTSHAKPRVNWRESFWRLPGETRLNVRELAEGLGHSPSCVWKRLRGADAIPHQMIDG